jgi:cobalt-zinc-cadmium efflux system outer membrane protein
LSHALSPPTPGGAAKDRQHSRDIRLSWREIVRWIDRNPSLAASRLHIEAARAAVVAESAIPNPTLEASLGEGQARIGDETRAEWGLQLTLPLGWLAGRQGKRAAAEAEMEATVGEAKVQRREVLLELKTLFWRLVYDQAHVLSLEALEAQTTELVRLVKKRVEQGEARPVEATRVELELEKVGSETVAARSARASRQAQLAQWLGWSSRAKPLWAVAELSALPAVPQLEAALAKLPLQHPQLAARRAQQRSLKARVLQEKMARVPDFSLTGSASEELDRRAYGVTLAVTLPLWNWNSGRVRQAEAQLAAGHKQAEASVLELQLAVIEAHGACQSATTNAARLGKEIVPRSAQVARVMEKTYQLGEASLLELIDARRTLLEAHGLYLSALLQAQMDCARLGALLGENVS